jgi:uncharacterized protein with PQ loop repeat
MKLVVKSFLCALLISGFLVLINFLCPFLSFIKINTTHQITLMGSYIQTTYLGIFGIDKIQINETRLKVELNNQITDSIGGGQKENKRGHEYINTNDVYKGPNLITIPIEFIVIFIVMIIYFHKNKKSKENSE